MMDARGRKKIGERREATKEEGRKKKEESG